MSAHDNGGQAFPVAGMALPNDQFQYPEYGMTLRDYFAAKVLEGLALRYDLPRQVRVDGRIVDSVAEFCFQQADAMLRAREAK